MNRTRNLCRSIGATSIALLSIVGLAAPASAGILDSSSAGPLVGESPLAADVASELEADWVDDLLASVEAGDPANQTGGLGGPTPEPETSDPFADFQARCQSLLEGEGANPVGPRFGEFGEGNNTWGQIIRGTVEAITEATGSEAAGKAAGLILVVRFAGEILGGTIVQGSAEEFGDLARTIDGSNDDNSSDSSDDNGASEEPEPEPEPEPASGGSETLPRDPNGGEPAPPFDCSRDHNAEWNGRVLGVASLAPDPCDDEVVNNGHDDNEATDGDDAVGQLDCEKEPTAAGGPGEEPPAPECDQSVSALCDDLIGPGTSGNGGAIDPALLEEVRQLAIEELCPPELCTPVE